MTTVNTEGAPAPTPTKRHVGFLLGMGILILPIVFAWFTLRSGYSVLARSVSLVWLVVSLLIFGSASKTPSTELAARPAATATSPGGGEPVQAGSTVQEGAEASTGLTGPQENAVRSARSYLGMSGFSRAGLIAQLSSSAGDGYSVGDATAAVDSLSVDWNDNAEKSAKQYLSMTGFSCKGLVQQLSSSAGDKYTKSEAAYGAQQAGAC